MLYTVHRNVIYAELTHPLLLSEDDRMKTMYHNDRHSNLHVTAGQYTELYV